MTVELKRRASFSAAHNYWLTALSAEQNAELFGKWAGERGHGHNYDIEVTVAGEIDPTTGMVVNIVDIDRIVKSQVVSVLDGKFLNFDVSYFSVHSPTLEYISEFCWDRIEPQLPVEATLTTIRVWEMSTLWATRYRSGDKLQVSITRAYDFAALPSIAQPAFNG